jgi:methylglutaconyl-CoA hydratase
MKPYQTLEIDICNYTATIWLNRPDVHNAVNNQMLEELAHFFGSLNSFKNLRLVVLRGKGKSFCSGADLRRLLESNQLSYDENLKDAYLWAECLNKIYNAPVPTVAVAAGNVFGGGNGLLCASDIVIAEENSAFAFSEVKIGLAPSTILPYVLTRLNEHKAKYLMLTGKKIGALEAERFNLVDFVTPANNIETLIASISTEITNASPSGIQEVKRLMRELKKDMYPNGIAQLTAQSIATLKISAEALEGISAFIDKRSPNWDKQSS